MRFPRRFGLGLALGDRGATEAEIQRVVGANADTVEAFHTSRIDDHAVGGHFFVDANVGGADGGTVAALFAGVRDANPGRGELVKRGEEPAVGAAIGAESLSAEEVDRPEAANQQERNGHEQAGESLPELGRGEMNGKTRPIRKRSRPRDR